MRAKRPMGCACVRVAVRILSGRGCVTAERDLFDVLRRLGWIDGNRASAAALRAGYLRESAGKYAAAHEEEYIRVFLTRYGIDELANRLPRYVRSGIVETFGIVNQPFGF
jgi:hypothetical protein